MHRAEAVGRRTTDAERGQPPSTSRAAAASTPGGRTMLRTRRRHGSGTGAARSPSPCSPRCCGSGTSATPHSLVFDETFYVKDAYTLLNLGYESHLAGRRRRELQRRRHRHLHRPTGSFVVHPPLGKWIIALGLAAFGADNAVGWRIGTASSASSPSSCSCVIARRCSARRCSPSSPASSSPSTGTRS